MKISKHFNNISKKYNMRLYNYALFALVAIASVYGLIMIQSVDSSFTLKQAVGISAAIVWMTFLSFVNYKFILRYYKILYAILIVLLILVKLVGRSALGAQRWIGTGSFQIQPSEIGKIILIIFLAQLLYQNKSRLDSWRLLLKLAILLFLPLALVLIEPDLSQTILTLGILTIMIFAGGIPYKKLGKIFAVVVPAFIVFFIYIQNPDQKLLAPYQWRRIMAFINPDEFADNVYQQRYSVEAIGSGGLTGKGLGGDDPTSLLDAGYIPEAHTDFIFAAIGEQLGFIGCFICIALLAAIVFVILRAASKCEDKRGRLICIGIAAYIGLQSFINIGVVTKLLPNTGLALPFFSYGLSSLMSLFTSIGIVLNICLQSEPYREKDVFSKGVVTITESRDDERKTRRIRL